jgi:hypothetical protein
MRVYSYRSSGPAPSTKNVASKRLLIAVVALIIIIPVVFVGAFYFYFSQPPITRQNVSVPSYSPYSPGLSPSPELPGNSPPSNQSSSPSANIPKYTLSEAISSGIVEANITGVTGLVIGATGASSGDVIILHIKRLVNYTFEIVPLPTGTLLVPNFASAQPMAILTLKGLSEGFMYRTRSQIILDTSDPVNYLFSAYCVDFTKDNPTASTVFTQNGTADPKVVQIFNAVGQLSANITTIQAIQSAVFAVTNNVSPSELTSRFNVNSTDLANAKTIIQKAGIDPSNLRLFQ